MLRVTRDADYALRMMLEVGARPESIVSTLEVARRQDIPYQFLRKVARTLVTSGLLRSSRGSRGGLSLARAATDISLLDIVRAFGPAALNRCTLDPPECDRWDACSAYPVWLEAQRAIDKVLLGTKLDTLVKRQAAKDRAASRAATG